MKKTFKKLLCIALSTAMLFSVCAMHSSALYQRVEFDPDGNYAPDGYTYFEDDLFSGADGTYFYRENQMAGKYDWIIKYSHVHCNQLEFVAEDVEAFQTIYAEYEELLDFDVVEFSELHNYYPYYDMDNTPVENVVIATMYDQYLTPDKQPVIKEFCNALTSAGVELYEVKLYPISAQQENGFFGHTLSVRYVPESEQAVLESLVADMSRTTDTDGVDDSPITVEYDRNRNCFDVDNVPSLDEGMEIRDRIKAIYPEAVVKAFCLYQASNDTVESDPIDLTPAAPAPTLLGDVNLDGRIDLIDAVVLGKAVAGSVTLSEVQQANSDIDQNDTIDTEDVSLLLRFLLHLEESIG